jgi:hypothetical protein
MKRDWRCRLWPLAYAFGLVISGCGGGGGSSSAGTAPAPPPQEGGYDLVALWETNSTAESNSFYTTDYQEKHRSIFSDGYVDRGVAAWLPCAEPTAVGPDGRLPVASTVHDNLGYSSLTDVPMRFACARPANARPLYRLDQNAPNRYHFYTSSQAEAEAALSNGWQFERVEGYLLAAQVDGSMPLYRVARCVPAASGCSVEHRYTLSVDARTGLLRDGWADEGVEGYAFDGYNNPTALVSADGNVNGLVTRVSDPIRTSIQNVAPPKQYIVISGVDSGRPATTVSGYVVSDSSPRPPGATRQRIVFSLYTGTLSEPGTNIDHIPVFLRFHAQLGSDGFPGVPYDGLGIFFSIPRWNNNQCGSSATGGAQIFVERVANASRMVNGGPAMEFVDCAANLPAPLKPDHTYSITVTVTDDARLGYAVTDLADGSQFANFPLHDYRRWYACPLSPQVGALSTASAHCANPFSPDRFASFRTGYLVWPLFSPQASNAQGALQAVTVQWLDENDVVLSSQ